ncbi:MAG TPA: CHAD domain-containing protein [Steroidobacteraceae bacterium]|nr:CHAD domain-containing protein [Steroidobacteraceae bacterium]
MTHPPRHPAPATLGRARAAAPANGAGTAGGEAREVEWQLTAPDLSVVRRWLEQHTLLDHLSITPLPVQQLHDTYLDTGDWRVFRAGFALRLRNKGGHTEATLKGLRSTREDVADRRELTEPLSESRASALAHANGPVGSRVSDVAGVKPLRTLFEVRTSRQRFAVRTGNPAVDVGEIALDEARFSRGAGHRRPMLLTRVEVEVVGPDRAPLERLAEQLRSECGLCPATENKFAVGLRSASLVPPRGAGPDREPEPAPAVIHASTRAGDFAAEVLRRLIQEWQANEPPARLGEGPEALHKLRVTARRMQTVLSLFRSYVPAGLRRTQPTLKGLLNVLGIVRDADIRLEAASAYRRTLPEADRAGLDPLLQYLQAERARARHGMLRALDAKRTRDWLDTLPDQLARTPLPTASVSARNPVALTVVPDLIHGRYRKLRKSARRLTRESSMTEFHEVRVRAKKLRYALEVVAPTYAKPAVKMLAALHKLQSKLGTQHDADVISRYLAQLASRPPATFTAVTLFMMGRMAEAYARDAARMGAKVKGPWRKVRRRRWKALRARMAELRDDVPVSNGEDRPVSIVHALRGNGKLHDAAGRWAFHHAIGHRVWN